VSVVLEHLGLRAGAKTLLDDVSLSIAPGTWCTIIGPNGAGKTSLVETMAGLRQPTRGRVLIDGEAISAMSARQRARRLAFVPQHPIVPEGMSVDDYVALGRTSYQGFMRGLRTQDFALIESTLVRLGLDDLRHRALATLSGGERQRAVLARALVQSTMVVVLDEPTTGLDVRHQMEMLEYLRKEVTECGLTVIATLHDLTLAGQFADRLVVFNQGRVVLDGPSRDVVRSPELGEHYGTKLRVLEVDGSDVVVPLRR
jgi:iron complex transport system ATP-binding protein